MKRLMKRLMACAGVLALFSGCSILAMRPAPSPIPKDTYPQCSETIAPVALDFVVGILGTLILAQQVGEQPKPDVILGVGVPTTVFLGSGIYGGVVRKNCLAAREEAEATIKKPY
jgi:hypothetical protein